ncbi:MAG TPA: hypothetical protein EYG92_07540 [Lutibacter sp.]|nr:hypothetical protein [Lutibacter sp.]
MSRLFWIFSLTSVFLISCTVNETPEFIKVSNVGIENYSTETITVTSDLVFQNPNSIGGVLQANEVKVWVNTIDLGNVNSDDFQVPSKKEFTVPILFEIPYNRIFKDKENIVLNVLTALQTKTIEVSYKGNVTYKLGAFTYDYPMDYTEIIDLK